MTGTSDRLVAAYLSRLEDATSGLPAGVRAEVVRDVADHIGEARADLPGDDPADVRAILADLGTPDQIALEAASQPAPAPPSAAAGQGRQRKYDVATVLVLSVGSLCLPVIGWLVGVVLLWRGPRWSRGDKLLGSLVVPLGPFGLVAPSLLTFSLSRQVCLEPTDGGPTTCEPVGPMPTSVYSTVVAVSVVCGLAVCVYLYLRARRLHGYRELTGPSAATWPGPT